MEPEHNYGIERDNKDQDQDAITENRLKKTQAEVDEVLDIMKDNVQSILKRGENLSELDERADNLQNNAAQFENKAYKLKRKHWWENTKMMIIMGVIAVCLLIFVIMFLFV